MACDWTLPEFKRLTAFAQQLADPQNKAHALSYIENHDQARAITRFASDAPEHRVASGKLIATYLLTLSGSLIIYEGQEIGMINAPKEWDVTKEYKDVNTINTWREIQHDAKVQNNPDLLARGKAGIQLTARDHARTPMQWDRSPNAGFSTNSKVKPWMRVMDSYLEGINVADQENDPESVLNFYRRLLKLRNEQRELLVLGKFDLVDPENSATMVYTKTSRDGSKKALVVLNFSGEKQPLEIPADLQGKPSKMLFSTLDNAADAELAAYEARLFVF